MTDDPETAQRPSVGADLGELLRLAGPVVMARLGIMVMGLTDAIIVGRYSGEQLAFHALGWAPTSVIVTTAVGLLLGVQVMTARLVGQGRRRETGAVLRRGISYAFWIGIASTLAMLALGPLFLRSLGLEPQLAAGASNALLVFSLSLTPYLISVAATFYLEALSRPGPGMWSMWAANLVNLGLNLLFVPGAFGIPAMGAVGGAWATFGARVFLMVVLLAWVWRMADARELGVFDKPAPNRAEAAEQRRIGYGGGASYFVETAAFSGMNLVAGWLGALVVAGYAVVLNVAAVIFMVPLGLSAATAVLVGRAYGARDRQGVARAGWLGFGVAMVFGGLVSALVWPLAPAIAGAYTRQPELVALAAPALVLSCLFFAADSLQVVAAQALRARGEVWLPTVTHVISYAAIMAPLAWWLAHPMKLGLNGIIWAVILASLVSAGCLVGRFWFLGRRPL
ncbi:MAG TPA: MATE family efflux transporter [Caulobacter sp.]|nr:MATE family efflux transporter [Caulobacter sp.]